MQHQINYFCVPNTLIASRELTASDFAVGAYLYSLASAYGSETLLGLSVRVKQTTIAEHCNMSTDTVARAVARLMKQGIIISKQRNVKENGYLGTYTYIVKPFNRNEHKYTKISKKAANLLQPNELRVYALFCLCKENYKNSFYHSYNDLVALLGMKKQQIIKAVDKLITLGLVRKQKRKTACGDYTENKYFIVIQVRGGFKGKNGKKRTATCSSCCSSACVSVISSPMLLRIRRKIFNIRGSTLYAVSCYRPT